MNGTAVVALDIAAALFLLAGIIYIACATWIFILHWQEWRSLKQGVTEGKLTERQMDFMDILAEAKSKPLRHGLVTAITWPILGYYIWWDLKKTIPEENP